MMGIICLRALYISKRKSNSKLTNYLIFHTISLGTLNVIGLITTILSFDLFFLPVKTISEQKLCFSDGSGGLHNYDKDEIFWQARHVYSKLKVLTIVSNLVFAISGLLTDAMLVGGILSSSRFKY